MKKTLPDGSVFSLLNRLEISLLYAANGASEGLGKIFPRGAGLDTVIGISRFLVVYVAADSALVFHSLSSFRKIVYPIADVIIARVYGLCNTFL